jgi:hypothetical protein
LNGKRTGLGHDQDGERFDPGLAALFDEVHETPLEGDAFIRGVLGELQRARRRRLLRRVLGVVLALTAGAFAAPVVGELTFAAVDWLTLHLSVTGFVLASPAACAMAALITWRIARRGYQ